MKHLIYSIRLCLLPVLFLILFLRGNVLVFATDELPTNESPTKIIQVHSGQTIEIVNSKSSSMNMSILDIGGQEINYDYVIESDNRSSGDYNNETGEWVLLSGNNKFLLHVNKGLIGIKIPESSSYSVNTQEIVYKISLAPNESYSITNQGDSLTKYVDIVGIDTGITFYENGQVKKGNYNNTYSNSTEFLRTNQKILVTNYGQKNAMVNVPLRNVSVNKSETQALNIKTIAPNESVKVKNIHSEYWHIDTLRKGYDYASYYSDGTPDIYNFKSNASSSFNSVKINKNGGYTILTNNTENPLTIYAAYSTLSIENHPSPALSKLTISPGENKIVKLKNTTSYSLQPEDDGYDYVSYNNSGSVSRLEYKVSGTLFNSVYIPSSGYAHISNRANHNITLYGHFGIYEAESTEKTALFEEKIGSLQTYRFNNLSGKHTNDIYKVKRSQTNHSATYYKNKTGETVERQSTTSSIDVTSGGFAEVTNLNPEAMIVYGANSSFSIEKVNHNSLYQRNITPNKNYFIKNTSIDKEKLHFQDNETSFTYEIIKSGKVIDQGTEKTKSGYINVPSGSSIKVNSSSQNLTLWGHYYAFIDNINKDFIEKEIIDSTYGNISNGEYVSDPVNITNGNYVYQTVDFSVQSIGLPLEFGRYYNSKNQTSTSLGKGWSHTFNSFIEKLNDSSLRVQYPDGKMVIFKNYNGDYRPVPGITEELVQTDEGYQLIFKNQMVLTYSSDGKLIQMKDRNENELNLTYDNNQLVNINDSTGRSINLQYNNEGYLTLAKDPAGGTVHFKYDGKQQLVESVDRNGQSTLFIYDEHGITSVTDKDGTQFINNTYDEESRVVKQIDGAGNITLFTYDPEKRFNTVTDPKGNTTTYQYNEYFRVTKVTNAKGFVSESEYDDQMNKISVSDNKGNTALFSYDRYGNITKQIIPGKQQAETILTYNDNNQIIEEQNPQGQITYYTYDSRGNLLKTERKRESTKPITTIYEYNETGKVTSVTNELEEKTIYKYDSFGNQIESTDPLDRTTKKTFDHLGRVLTVTDAKGNTTKYEYDKESNLVGETFPDESTIKYTYDGNGNVLTRTDAKNNQTSMTYNWNNNLKSKTDEDGHTIVYDYDENQNLIKTTYPNGYSIYNQYNTLNQLVLSVDSLNRAEKKTYDKNGNLETETDSKNLSATVLKTLITEINLDAKINKGLITILGYKDGKWQSVYSTNQSISDWVSLESGVEKVRLTSSEDFEGNAALLKVKTDNNDEQTADASLTINSGNQETLEFLPSPKIIVNTEEDATLSYQYNERNERILGSNKLNRKVEYQYDILGQLTDIIDVKGQVTKYEYNDLNQLVGVIDGQGNKTVYSYDTLGQLIKSTNAKNQTTQYLYDQAGQLIEEIDSLNNKTSYEYDANGNQTAVKRNEELLIQYEYDKNNRLIAKTESDNRIQYEYDPNGNLKSMTDATGTTIYEYNKLNQISKVVYPNEISVSYEYDEQGNVKQLDYPDQTKVKYIRDSSGLVTSIKDWNGKEVQLNRSVEGLVENEIYPNGLETKYTYNELSEIKSIENKQSDQTLFSRAYEYDERGQWKKSVNEEQKETLYSYDALQQLIKVQNDKTNNEYQYDEIGNRKELKTINSVLSYDYNNGSQLLEIKSNAGDEQINLEYDSNGNVVKKGDNVLHFNNENQLIRYTSPGHGISYKYNGLERLVQKTVNGKTETFIYNELSDDARLLAVIDENGNTTSKFINNTIMEQGEKTYYLLKDGQGSVIQVIDEAGVVAAEYEYSPFGKMTLIKGELTQPFGFTGAITDHVTGLLYLNVRHYDPETGRFVSKDPYKGEKDNPISLNPYIYSYNDPINLYDPSGMSPIEIDDSLWDINNDLEDWSDWINFIPGVGFIKGAYEASTGHDLLTDNSLNGNMRFYAMFGMVPGGGFGKVGKKLGVDNGTGKVSKYEDVTKSGSRYANRATDVTKADFEKNLLKDGWKKTTSKDGKTTILTKDGAKYVLRDGARSTGGPTADFYPSGSKGFTLKIRLK